MEAKINNIPEGRKVKVYAPDISDNPVSGTVAKSKGVANKYVQLSNGDEIFASDIKEIWGIDNNGNRE